MRLHVLAIRSSKRSHPKKKLNDDEDRYGFLWANSIKDSIQQIQVDRIYLTEETSNPGIESSKISVAPFRTSPRTTFPEPKALRVLGRTIRSSLWNLWDEADQALTMFVICDDFFCSQNPSQWICLPYPPAFVKRSRYWRPLASSLEGLLVVATRGS